MNLKDAYAHVKSKRPQIGPNKGFMQQLMDFEKLIHGTQSFSFEEYFVSYFIGMGFQKEKVEQVLKDTDYDFELALTKLLAIY